MDDCSNITLKTSTALFTDGYFCLQEPEKQLEVKIGNDETGKLRRTLHSFPVFPAKRSMEGIVTIAVRLKARIYIYLISNGNKKETRCN